MWTLWISGGRTAFLSSLSQRLSTVRRRGVGLSGDVDKVIGSVAG